MSKSHRIARAWAKRIAFDVGGKWTAFSYSEERVDVIAPSLTIEIKVRQLIPAYVREAIKIHCDILNTVPSYVLDWKEQAIRYEAQYEKPCYICWCQKGVRLREVILISMRHMPHSIRWGDDLFLRTYGGHLTKV